MVPPGPRAYRRRMWKGVAQWHKEGATKVVGMPPGVGGERMQKDERLVADCMRGKGCRDQ